MATSAAIVDGPAPEAGSRRIAGLIDRWIYVGMAGMMIAVALLGFIPDSIDLISGVNAGTAPPLPPILHVHALLMGSWLLLLLTQATLMATGRKSLHMQLGVAAFALAPAMIVVGFILVPVRYWQLVDAIAAAPPAVAAQLRAETLPLVIDLKLTQVRAGILFALFVGIALAVRLRHPDTHKRFLILGTLAPLEAGIDRIAFLPATVPASPLSADLYPVLLALPMIAWDLYRRRRLPGAYAIWFVALAITAVPENMLWGTAWWLHVAPRLLGAG
jgi:hypothetical protein